MFGLSVEIQDATDRVRRAARDAESGSVRRTAFLIRETAVKSIERSEGPSAIGAPPHTHKGNWLRRAIRYAVDKASAVIGPMFSVLGEAGKAHEFGGMFRGQQFDKRPFMGPSLDKNLDLFVGSFAGSVHS